MAEFKVPFAIDKTQALFSAEVAEKGRGYFCPACGTVVILRKGKIRIAHFSHKVSISCSRETVIHKTAKLIVHKAITDWKTGQTGAPLVKRQCNVCHTTIEQPLPDKVESACIEYRLPNNFIADVALLVQERAAATVEIRVTHAVDEAKSGSMPVPFIELDGKEVLSSPNLWNPIVDKFNKIKCQSCADNLKKLNTKCSAVASIKRVLLPTSYYRYSICECPKCKKPTIVFTWPGADNDGDPLKKPKPSSIKSQPFIHSKYFANTCIHCNCRIGNFDLYCKPDGPFYEFKCGADTAEDFREDQKKLAHHANCIKQI